MGQRSDQRTRDADLDDLDGIDDLGLDSSAESEASGSRLAGLTGSSGLFSVSTFLITLVLSAIAVFAGGAVIPFLGGLAGLVGLFVVGFATGLVGENHSYVEVGLAGALASGAAFTFENLVFTAIGLGLPLAALGVGSGLVVALLGHYFGRDLRAGLTESI